MSYERQTTITFYTDAPEDAPETRGSTRYFKPERLEWSVTPTSIFVSAQGPGTRTAYGRDAAGYTVEGFRSGTERPAWLMLPIEQLAAATMAAQRIEELRGESHAHD